MRAANMTIYHILVVLSLCHEYTRISIFCKFDIFNSQQFNCYQNTTTFSCIKRMMNYGLRWPSKLSAFRFSYFILQCIRFKANSDASSGISGSSRGNQRLLWVSDLMQISVKFVASFPGSLDSLLTIAVFSYYQSCYCYCFQVQLYQLLFISLFMTFSAMSSSFTFPGSRQQK